MPFYDPDPTDPTMLVGVMSEGAAESMKEMAYSFAEEFASLGYDEGALVALFQDPSHALAFGALGVLGEPDVRRIIRECVGFYGRVRFRVEETPEEELVQIGGLRSLGL